MVKKIILSVLLVVHLFVASMGTLVSTVSAQEVGPWFNQSPEQWYSKVYDDSNPQEIFGERYTAAQVDWIIMSVLTWLPSKISPPITKCVLSAMNSGLDGCFSSLLSSSELGENRQTLSSGENRQALSSGESLVGLVFAERSFSGISYFKNIARKFNLIPEASAQTGFGFATALEPILPLWKVVRDATYGLFVIVTIVLAFMIMFRIKISPQIVISVQSALPKLVVALLLVTFSYAIAGFLVDLLYVFLGFASLLFSGFFPNEVRVPITDALVNVPSMIFVFLTEGKLINLPFSGGILGLVVFYLTLFTLTFVLVISLMMGVVGGIFTGIAIGSIAPISIPILAIIGILLLVIVIVLILWIAFKTAWSLLKAYASLLFLTILAPLQILLGVLVPKLGFSQWIKSFVSALAIFATTSLLFFFSFFFLYLALIYQAQNSVAGGDALEFIANGIFGTFVVDLFEGGSAGWPPLLGVSGISSIPLLFLGVSLVTFFIIPKTAELIKSLAQGKPFVFGSAIGEAFTPLQKTYDSGPVRAYREESSKKTAGTISGIVASVLKSGGAQKVGDRVHDVQEKLDPPPRGAV